MIRTTRTFVESSATTSGTDACPEKRTSCESAPRRLEHGEPADGEPTADQQEAPELSANAVDAAREQADRDGDERGEDADDEPDAEVAEVDAVVERQVGTTRPGVSVPVAEPGEDEEPTAAATRPTTGKTPAPRPNLAGDSTRSTPATTGPPKSVEIAENEPALDSKAAVFGWVPNRAAIEPTTEPRATTGASGPSTAPKGSEPSAASATPGPCAMGVGRAQPSSGEWPLSPGRKSRATTTMSTHDREPEDGEPGRSPVPEHVREVVPEPVLEVVHEREEPAAASAAGSRSPPPAGRRAGRPASRVGRVSQCSPADPQRSPDPRETSSAGRRAG